MPSQRSVRVPPLTRGLTVAGAIGAHVFGCAGGRPVSPAEPATARHATAAGALSDGSDTVSAGTRRLLGSLKRKVHIEVFVTRGWPSLDTFVGNLVSLLRGYQRASGTGLTFEVTEANNVASKAKAQSAGAGTESGPLAELEFSAQSEADPTVTMSKSGYLGMVIHYGDEKDTIPQLSSDGEGMEFWISTKLQEVRERGDRISHKIGVVSGKDELKLSDTHLLPGSGPDKPSLQAILRKHFANYDVKEVDLLGGSVEIDDTFEGLIITQPGQDYTEKELRRIDQFVMKGKGLAVFASAVNTRERDDTMAVTLNRWGLDTLLAGYGIGLENTVVVDVRSPASIRLKSGGDDSETTGPPVSFWFVLQSLDHPDFTGHTRLLDTSFPGLFKTRALAVPMVSSLTLNTRKQPGANLRPIMRTTDAALSIDEPIQLEGYKPQKSDKPSWRQRTVAASLEGTLRSAFQGGDTHGITAPGESVPGARVFVLASSQFLTNPLARALGPGGGTKGEALAGAYAREYLANTILALKSTLGWMTCDMDLIKIAGQALARPGRRRATP